MCEFFQTFSFFSEVNRLSARFSNFNEQNLCSIGGRSGNLKKRWEEVLIWCKGSRHKYKVTPYMPTLANNIYLQVSNSLVIAS